VVVSDDDFPSLSAGWFEYIRLASGSRAERKGLELGEPADALRAAERVREVVERGGSRAVALIAALLDAAADERAVVAVAVGPLEDLLHDHWDESIDEVEKLARAEGPMRRALTSVYLTGDRETRLRPWMR
jgi:hypothetical protein